MCELFAVNGIRIQTYNDKLKTFFSHSKDHPHGWGLATVDENEDVIVEKEPLQASKSFYLHERMLAPIEGKVLFAHIRYATIGNLGYLNCHPFTMRDISGRRWTMIHNGTIFECDALHAYSRKQRGETDSERVFLYLMDCVNSRLQAGELMGDKERFDLLDSLVLELAPHNKLNLIIYDSEQMYVHTNQEGTLYCLQESDRVLFSTTPLSSEEWKRVPMTRLLAYREGRQVFAGTVHNYVYEPNQQSIDQLYQIFANL